MEWRLSGLMKLLSEQKKLEKQTLRLQRLSPHFNLHAKGARSKRWLLVTKLIGQRFEQNVESCVQTMQEIQTRNEEGNTLLDEIFALDKKRERLEKGLRRAHRPVATIVREGEAAAALARLSVQWRSLGHSFDVPDLSILVQAACAVEQSVSEV